MTAYHYQCAGCCCTLYADELTEEDDDYCWAMNGELCSNCQAQQAQQSTASDDFNYDD